MKIRSEISSIIGQREKEFNRLPKLRQIGLIGAEAARQNYNRSNSLGLRLNGIDTPVGNFIRLNVSIRYIIRKLRIGFK